VSSPSKVRSEVSRAEIPAVPLTLEGSSVLHQMMHFKRTEWRKLPAKERSGIEMEARSALEKMELNQSGLYSVLGHKGDLMLVHFRNSFDELNQIELTLGGLRLSDFLETTTSYLSVVELGL